VPETVKSRPYNSSRRQAQVEATRSAVIDAARRLFLQGGYAATTVEAISSAASVAPATVYRLFGSKRGVLAAVFDIAFGGDDQPLAFHERPQVRAALASADPAALLYALMPINQALKERTADLEHVLRQAAPVDPEAAEMLATVTRQRATGQARIAHALAERGALTPGIDETAASDIIFTLMSPEVHRLLTVDRNWTDQRYAEWLGRTLEAVLLGDDAPSRD
jgi:AcrR family transcriptional regulator